MYCISILWYSILQTYRILIQCLTLFCNLRMNHVSSNLAFSHIISRVTACDRDFCLLQKIVAIQNRQFTTEFGSRNLQIRLYRSCFLFFRITRTLPHNFWNSPCQKITNHLSSFSTCRQISRGNNFLIEKGADGIIL